MYFFTVNESTTLEDLKKQYYRLAKQYHPDVGGDQEAFKKLNNEYEKLQDRILNNSGFTAEERRNESDIGDAYREVINALITIQGISIEIIGTWIWIGGNTYPVKDQIKAAGFRFHRKKVMWYWHAGDYRKSGGKEMSIDEIRERYGSRKVKTAANYNQLSGIGSVGSKLLRLQKLLNKKEKINTKKKNFRHWKQ